MDGSNKTMGKNKNFLIKYSNRNIPMKAHFENKEEMYSLISEKLGGNDTNFAIIVDKYTIDSLLFQNNIKKSEKTMIELHIQTYNEPRNRFCKDGKYYDTKKKINGDPCVRNNTTVSNKLIELDTDEKQQVNGYDVSPNISPRSFNESLNENKVITNYNESLNKGSHTNTSGGVGDSIEINEFKLTKKSSKLCYSYSSMFENQNTQLMKSNNLNDLVKLNEISKDLCESFHVNKKHSEAEIHQAILLARMDKEIALNLGYERESEWEGLNN